MLRFWQILIHLCCLSPAIWLGYALSGDNPNLLGSDPIKEIEHFLGYTAIIIFCVMFLVGIMLQVLRKNQYQILRRPLGLWAFVWAALHVTSYFMLELGQDVRLFFSELFSRPYLILGFIAFAILTVMAITSLPSLKRKLGQKWFKIHQWAYPAIGLAAVHYYWSVKSVTLAPLVIGACVFVILLWKWLSPRFLR
ncbi:protein-methionine-sulfoxide reductase heme-binding subunit MsrQ [Rodentibacter myodis]|uniref:Protein-methionine-sulfoxide reductase heme-binding subunit MsrQ n=1 Tax=Rodentibacter myodis TaxID=1907939 RepID=A0A1V3JPJ6_9PAST|nr:protein-methionine-sulfoxide reductase heme-binding subunit MsrQ [Rodentibacter myodis]OOF58614.1 sulfoxide reductase heme-binding subunit YedZ [Rodentibacter myodis]